MEMIYKKLIWPLYKTHKHALDALKEVLAGDDSILEGLKICLLYTSPSPRDKRQSRMPSSA